MEGGDTKEKSESDVVIENAIKHTKEKVVFYFITWSWKNDVDEWHCDKSINYLIMVLSLFFKIKENNILIAMN